MTLHIYECSTAPQNRRFIAQFDQGKNNLHLVIYGPTAELARAKAQLFIDYRATDDRKKFNLKGKLTALGEPAYDPLDDIL